MHLESIHLVNFRNYQEQRISFCEGLNIISGKNGAGKTNLLEAINYLCLTKGYFHTGDLGAIKFNEEYFRLQGEFISDEKPETISLAFQSGTPKLLQHDKIDYEKLADHIGKFPLVVIAPDDIVLVLEGSEERRKWLDNTISQVNRLYLNDLMQYNRILSQRNALLKQWASGVTRDEQLMNVFDDQLVSLGKQIFEERKKCLQILIPILQKHYAFISDEHETALMNYESLLNDKDFSKVLQANRERDIVLQRTTSGIHRDDLDFLLNENSLKKFGSQGQKKSFLIALKLAQFDFIREKKNCTPLLLLDDIFDKLDQHRSEKLLTDATSNNRGQVFITCTEWNGNIKSNKSVRHYSAKAGVIEVNK